MIRYLILLVTILSFSRGFCQERFEVKNIGHANVENLDAPLLQISATYIRNLIASGKSIKHLVPPLVEKEIVENGYYRNLQKK